MTDKPTMNTPTQFNEHFIPGLTLRDYLAAAIITGLLASGDFTETLDADGEPEPQAKRLTKVELDHDGEPTGRMKTHIPSIEEAYCLADRMLEQRKQA